MFTNIIQKTRMMRKYRKRSELNDKLSVITFSAVTLHEELPAC